MSQQRPIPDVYSHVFVMLKLFKQIMIISINVDVEIITELINCDFPEWLSAKVSEVFSRNSLRN
jgi:hypothetical protein